jgi:hypothetical protein
MWVCLECKECRDEKIVWVDCQVMDCDMDGEKSEGRKCTPNPKFWTWWNCIPEYSFRLQTPSPCDFRPWRSSHWNAGGCVDELLNVRMSRGSTWSSKFGMQVGVDHSQLRWRKRDSSGCKEHPKRERGGRITCARKWDFSMNVPAESKLRFQVLNQEIPSIRNNIMTKLESMVLPMSHQEWVRKLSSPQLRQKKAWFLQPPRRKVSHWPARLSLRHRASVHRSDQSTHQIRDAVGI